MALQIYFYRQLRIAVRGKVEMLEPQMNTDEPDQCFTQLR
jgi:hypothetical protein